MRVLGEKESDVLLRASEDGKLDLLNIPGFVDGLPPIKYAQCTQNQDGTLTWEAKHLPVPCKWTWERFAIAERKQTKLMLTRDERTEIIKGFIKGEINDKALPRIYPLKRKPILASVVYAGFGDGARPGNMPKMPDDWCKQFDGFIPGKPMAAHSFEFFDVPDLHERGEYQKELEPFDWSTGKAIEPSMVYYYDSLCISIQLFICPGARGFVNEGS